MNKKPTQLKRIAGTLRRDRTNREEPQPKSVESLEPPVALDPEARHFWDYHATRLQKLGLLTECDTHALALAAKWWSVQERALDGLKGNLTHKTSSNGEVCKPQMVAAKTAFQAIRALMHDFGLNPVSRSRIHAPLAEDEPDPIYERFFTKKGA